MVNFGFDTFEQALDYFKFPTYYERDVGITEVKREVLSFSDTFKMVLILKSNNRKTMVLFYSSKGRWIYWVPMADDIKALKEVVGFYDTMDVENTEKEV